MGQGIRFADLAFELELNEAIERNRDGRLALDIDPVFAHVACDDGRETRGATLILPRQSRRERHRATLGGPLVRGEMGRFRSPDMLGLDLIHSTPNEGLGNLVHIKLQAQCNCVKAQTVPLELTCLISNN